MDHLITLLSEEDLDLAVITETWFKTQQNNYTANLKENGYSIFHLNREEKGGGGVAIIHRDTLKLNSAKCYNFETFECVIGTIASISSQKITFVAIYRFCQLSPSAFFLEFMILLKKSLFNLTI